MTELDTVFFETLRQIRNYLLLVDANAVKGRFPHEDGFIVHYNAPKGINYQTHDIEFQHCCLVLYHLNYGERRDEIAQVYDIQLVLFERMEKLHGFDHQMVFKVKGLFFRVFGITDDFMSTLHHDWTSAHEVALDLTNKLGFRTL